MDRCTCKKIVKIRTRYTTDDGLKAQRIELRDPQAAEIVVFHTNDPNPMYFFKYYRTVRSLDNLCCEGPSNLARFKSKMRSTLNRDFTSQGIICDNQGCNKTVLTPAELEEISILYFYSNNFEKDFISYMKQLFTNMVIEAD